MPTAHLSQSTILVISLVFGSTSFAQNYPTKPIRIVTGGAESVGDFTSRLIAHGLAENLGWTVVVENRGTIASAETTAKATPDGYTFFAAGNSIWIGPIMQKLSYDPVKDFAPVTIASKGINVLVVTPSLPVNSVKELIALAKAKPGTLNYAMSVVGGSQHLAAELFKSMAGVNIVGVPYKSSAPAILDLIGGRVELQFAPSGQVAPHMKSGRLRGLAVTSLQPSPLAPGLPTVASAGLNGYEMETIIGMFTPAKTPPTLINLVNREIGRVLHQPDSQEKLFGSGAEAVGSSAEQLSVAVKSEMARLGKVIKDAGIKID